MANGALLFVVVLGLLVVAFLILIAVGKYQTPNFVQVKIGTATVNAEVANTAPKQMRGLMFRDSLPKDGGMLFDFSREAKHGIWMMNMSIPIDIVWLDRSKKVIHIEHSVPPCDALMICPVYQPTTAAKYVLEVNAGYAKGHGIRIGTVADF